MLRTSCFNVFTSVSGNHIFSNTRMRVPPPGGSLKVRCLGKSAEERWNGVIICEGTRYLGVQKEQPPIAFKVAGKGKNNYFSCSCRQREKLIHKRKKIHG